MVFLENTVPSIWPVTCHTDHVGKDSTFVAIKGQDFDGVDFISLALDKGARKIIVAHNANVPPEIKSMVDARNASLVFVDDTRRALAQLSSHAYGFPARKLKIIAVTGTKGKTTTACLIHHLLQTAGYSAALMSTVHNKINETVFSPSLTTPQPDYIHMFFDQCVVQGVTHVVMEIAAQATSLERTYGLSFDAAVFTNFGHEHSEFYKTFDDYFEAKVHVLRQVKVDAPIVLNADDAKVVGLAKIFKYAQCYSVQQKSADFYGKLNTVNDQLSGSMHHRDQSINFKCPSLMGVFNGSNLIAAAAVAHLLGVSLECIMQAFASMPSLPGRLERYELKNGVTCIIDYAHTPDSYEQLLALLRAKTDHLTVLFGAGGARDKVKRPLMGAIAARYADTVFLTSDNPRMEDPFTIIEDIKKGISADDQRDKVIVELDREKAIVLAYQCTQKGGIIALLGKGPDEYQLVHHQKIPFSEKAIIKHLDNG